MEVKLKSAEIPDCNHVSAYFIRGEKLCPKIGIKYSEFSEFLAVANQEAIEALFKWRYSIVHGCLSCADCHFVRRIENSLGRLFKASLV